jgi:DNA-binding response OmpR family regulator
MIEQHQTIFADCCFIVEKNFMKKKILIIEDDKDTAELLVHVMERFNYDAVITTNIMDIADISAIAPDLIMLDHKLGHGLGSVLCKNLKSAETTKHIPILMVSGTHHLRHIAEQCGADNYIPKPFDLDDLEEKMAALLGKRK